MLNHRIEGHGPPLLMIHGLGISFPIWAGLRPYLCDHFTLIMVELPGIGSSPPPGPAIGYLAAALDGIEELRTSLDVERWHVLSYSSGTRIAEQYVRRHAPQVERAVFLCPARVRATSAAALRLALWTDGRYPSVGNRMLSGATLRFLIRLLAFNMRTDALAGEWLDRITCQPVATLKETLRAMPAGGAAEFHLPPEVSSLFIWGREDLITATPRVPSERDLIVPGAHSTVQKFPAASAAGIVNFLSARDGLAASFSPVQDAALHAA